MSAPRVAVAVLSAAALAVPLVTLHEGYNPKVYADPAPGAFATVCYGHRIDAPIGTVFAEQKCLEYLVQDLATHGVAIVPCLPAEVPDQTRAAYTSFAFNVGVKKFCTSTLAKKARAGDLAGSCAELDRWVYAGTMKLRGLAVRRKAERALCERGLRA